MSRPARRTTRAPVACHQPPAHHRGRAEHQTERRDHGARQERRTVVDVLHPLRQHEQHPERRDVAVEDRQRARRDPRSCEHAHVEQRVGSVELDCEERRDGGHSHHRGPEHRRARPSGVDTLDEGEHDPRQPHAGERRAGKVERGRPRPARLRQPAQSERSGDEHERDVDQEDPLPARHVDEHAAHDGSQCQRDPGDRRPDPQRLGPKLRREQHREQRQRGGQHAGRRRAHQRPRGDHFTHGLRRGGQHGGDGEADEPHHEDAPPPEPIGEAAADEQEAGQRDEERVEHPLQLADAGVELVRHLRQRDVDDRHVDRADEHRAADDPEPQPPLVPDGLVRCGCRREVDEVWDLDGGLLGRCAPRCRGHRAVQRPVRSPR